MAFKGNVVFAERNVKVEVWFRAGLIEGSSSMVFVLWGML